MAGWAAGIQAAGSIGGGVITALSQASANRKNIALSRENREWEEQMSNTAWQRAVEDMQRAGLNPMLAISQGPSSTPGHSAATVNPVDGIGRGVASASQAAAQAVQLQQAQANIDLTKANTFKTIQEGHSAEAIAQYALQREHQSVNNLKAQFEDITQRWNLTQEERQRLKEAFPILQRLNEARAKTADTESVTAKHLERQEFFKIPELEQTAKWFSGVLGGGGRFANAAKDILGILRQLRGK